MWCLNLKIDTMVNQAHELLYNGFQTVFSHNITSLRKYTVGDGPRIQVINASTIDTIHLSPRKDLSANQTISRGILSNAFSKSTKQI